jgi:Rha family phage regulatory protein
MSSREIAELTGKEHSHVMRDIRKMLYDLFGEEGLSMFGSSYINSQNKEQPCFNLPKRETLILISGYNIQMRSIIIDRWQELENNINKTAIVPLTQLTPHEIAVRQFKGEYEIWTLLECPVHIAQQEIVKIVKKDTGVDFSEVLKHASAQQNILPEIIMLEPTDIGIKLGLGSGIEVNRLLAVHGFQTRINGEWVPTSLGEPHCQKHAWAKKNKSGYNLKWNLKFLENYFNSLDSDSDT